MAMDEAKMGAFAQRMMDMYVGTILAYLLDIGERTKLFDAAATGPGTSAEIAERADLDERNVREVMSALATADIVEYDPATKQFTLPPEHAAVLTGQGMGNMAKMMRGATFMAKYVPDVARAVVDGKGVPYSVYRPEFTEMMDGMNRQLYDLQLVDGYLPAVPGLVDTLAAGARVADVGCGSGHSIALMAEAFPKSAFTGFDFAADAIEQAQKEADSLGLTNATFQVQDVAKLSTDEPFDVVFAFDAIHDQADPATVLKRVHDVLKPGGVFVMIDVRAASALEDNLGNPLASMIYGVSALHCMQVSLAEGGVGLGTAWGTELATQMLKDAGFGDVAVHDPPPTDFFNQIYAARK